MVKKSSRVFVYQSQYFSDPGPQYSVVQIQQWLSEYFPALVSPHATWRSRILPDGTEEIKFYKRFGQKGAGQQLSLFGSILLSLELFLNHLLQRNHSLDTIIAIAEVPHVPA